MAKRKMEERGIDPLTSRMLSERSTIWATPPTLLSSLLASYRTDQITHSILKPTQSKTILLLPIPIHRNKITLPSTFVEKGKLVRIWRIFCVSRNTVDLDLYFFEWDKTQVQKKRLIPLMSVGAAQNPKSSIETMSSSFRMETWKPSGIWIPFCRPSTFLQLQKVGFLVHSYDPRW